MQERVAPAGQETHSAYPGTYHFHEIFLTMPRFFRECMTSLPTIDCRRQIFFLQSPFPWEKSDKLMIVRITILI
jgi:hypothetical protein